MRAYKTEIKLTKEQVSKYRINISACRFVYNLFISINNEKYINKEEYINNYDFSKWLNNVYIIENEDKLWLKKASSKSIRNAINNCHRAYKEALNKNRGFPKYKKASTDKSGLYFVRNELKNPIKCCRHKIKVPCLGWITLKEKNYLPVDENKIISGTIIKRANRYFISVIVDGNNVKDIKNINEGMGIDLGINTFMVCSNGKYFSNINKTEQIKKLEKSLKRQQRALSRKYKASNTDEVKNFKNIEKNKIKIEKLHYKLECIRNSYINKCVDKIIEKQPNFITLEDLNVQDMLKNRHLSKAISKSKFYYTKQVLLQKANKHNIEVREVSRFFPSSKKCSSCGNINNNLTLKDRIYKCSCGFEIDRDLNAAINLKNCKEYKIISNTDGLSGINACGVLKNTIVVSDDEVGYVETRKSILYNKDSVIDKCNNLRYNYSELHSMRQNLR